MRLVFAGTPQIAVTVAEALSDHHQIQAVLTRPPAPGARSSRLVPSPLAQWAHDKGIKVMSPPGLRSRAVIDEFREISPDSCPVVAYGGLVSADLLGVPPLGWVNLHFSLLPAYRGAAPVQRALLDGSSLTGITTFRLVPELDAGPIYLQQCIDLNPTDTAGDVLALLAGMGAQALIDTLDLMGKGVLPSEQSTQGLSYAPKISADEARLDLGAPSRQIVNRVRAMSPEPGAWSLVGSQRFKILRAQLVESDLSGVNPAQFRPGQLLATKKELFCRCIDGWIELTQVQAMGKKPMSGADWARGAWQVGTSLE